MQTGSLMASKTLALAGGGRGRTLLLATIAGLAVLAAPGLVADALVFAARNLLQIAPVILAGIVLTAAITASGSMGLVAAAFAGREGRMILLAALVGALLPVCGLTVLPLVAGLLAAGVPLAPIMAFWLSSPVTDPGMLAVTAATLGAGFAAVKTLAAFGAGLLGGVVTLALTRAGRLAAPTKDKGYMARITGPSCGGPTAVAWRFWREPARRAQFRRTAYETGRLMLLWLSAAFVAEFFMNRYLPSELVAPYVGQESAWAVPIATLVGAPIYLEGYAALPLVRGLIDAGMRPDAAMAFLIAGGIVSAWAAIPVFALVRLPVFTLYVVLAVVSAMLAGWASGLVL